MRNAFFVAAFLLFAFTSAASAVDSIADVKTLAGDFQHALDAATGGL